MVLLEAEGLLLVSSGFPLLAAVLLLLLVYLCSTGGSKPRNGTQPPGPKPLPLLGNLLQLDLKKLHESLCELSKKYGTVFTIHFGPKKVVVLAGYKTVKQALVNHAEEFGDRDISPMFHDINKGQGIIFSNGENWKTMRRFALTNLRNFGMGKRRSEKQILDETRHLIEVFEKLEGTTFDTTQPVNYAVSNIISAIVYGSRFEYDDPRFQAMVKRASDNFRLTASVAVQLYNMFPWLKSFLKEASNVINNSRENCKKIKGYIENLLATLNPEDSRGFVDSFLISQQDTETSGQKDTLFHQENLIFCVSNLFSAGTDTTATTLRWGLLLMAKHPHIQKRVHEEIDRVIGRSQPVLEYRKNLPYTHAVIHEIQRFANIFPLNLPHITSCDVHFQGFFIRKGTSVIPLLTSVLRDESEWEKPYLFYPEHFLDDMGHFVKRDAFLPFSAGRRVCAGEGLAKMELFLFFTALLQRFCFTPPPGVSEEELDLTPVLGSTLNPSPHKLCAVSRS
ncbi:cytochrome P450 2K1-like [Sardina pilchardus]|uniref:cytochrome P450 2K1-like n=1 Tax=Sardina pilchardus TaxID=27697 RepID=UPI002E0F0543